jgi:hypothetical protein
VWERAQNSVEVVDELLTDFGEIHSVERHLEIHLFAAVEAWWACAHHSLAVDVSSWDELGRSIPLVVDESESTLDQLVVSDVGEGSACDHNLGTTLHGAVVRIHFDELRLDVVAEVEAGVDPVGSVQRDIDLLWCNDVIIGWRDANDTNSGDELRSDDLWANLAVRDQIEFELLVEPSAREFERSSSFGQSHGWEDFLDDWLGVGHELSFRVGEHVGGTLFSFRIGYLLLWLFCGRSFRLNWSLLLLLLR